MNCSLPAFRGFLDRTRGIASGWISFYWGRTTAEYKRSSKMEDAIMAAWLEFFQEQGPRFRAPATP